jgi:hypothetical protein
MAGRARKNLRCPLLPPLAWYSGAGRPPLLLPESGRRLFLASKDPSPVDPEATWQTMKINMQYGVVTINEARDAQGLPPVPWGDKPWLPDNQVQPKSEQ